MKNPVVLSSIALLSLTPVALPNMSAKEPSRVQAKVATGLVEGVVSDDGAVHAFKGIPYAAPPVGELRWKPPQPVAAWSGVRDASKFGARAMQVHVWDDMFFFDDGPSEDCLYLNVWTPAKSADAKLPVMVWIHGGGWIAGATSEPRQDGEELCKKGVVVVSMNYRMGVFGFLALPGLAEESEHHASGNYGLLDMVASLRWVHDNIAVFGGDPGNVTIFGESAGAHSVCALMASPGARGLFQKAIGESGSVVEKPTKTLAKAGGEGVAFAMQEFGTASPDELRKIPADELLKKSARRYQFGLDLDGYFLPRDAVEIYKAGDQAHVPLLSGWNLDESDYKEILGKLEPTPENYEAKLRELYGDDAASVLGLYPASNVAQVKRAAADLATDRFMGFRNWKWIELHRETGGSPVYRYLFEQKRPLPEGAPADAVPRATHASDIEFIFLALDSLKLPWRAEDRAVAELMASYWTNFAKTGNPNGPGLPEWPVYTNADGGPVMHLNSNAKASPDTTRARYEFLDKRGAARLVD